MSYISLEDVKNICEKHPELLQEINSLKTYDYAANWIPFELEPLDSDKWWKNGCRPTAMSLKKEMVFNTPDESQEILVSDGRYVWYDIYIDDGCECYLDTGNEFKDSAWMPLPTPYKKENTDG
jgi:hypothetical protein